MTRHITLTALTVAAALVTASTGAMCQIAQPLGGAPISPATPPMQFLPTLNPNPSFNEPGVPNTSTPGLIGTSASPSGMPGDSVSHPGFPSMGPQD